MMAIEPAICREYEHVRCRAVARAKPLRRVQLVAGRWPEWITGRDDADLAPPRAPDKGSVT